MVGIRKLVENIEHIGAIWGILRLKKSVFKITMKSRNLDPDLAKYIDFHGCMEFSHHWYELKVK